MKLKSICLLVFFFSPICFGQTVSPPAAPPSDPIEKISGDLSRITRAVQDLNKNLKDFLSSFSTSQGLQLTEKQQKMLLAFEILNRAEQRLATLQKLRIDLVEKHNSIKMQLARVEEDLREENLEKAVAFIGTTSAEEIRESRLRLLTAERNNLRSLVIEIQTTLSETIPEIRQLENLVKGIRQKLFTDIMQELSNF